MATVWGLLDLFGNLARVDPRVHLAEGFLELLGSFVRAFQGFQSRTRSQFVQQHSFRFEPDKTLLQRFFHLCTSMKLHQNRNLDAERVEAVGSRIEG